MEGLIGMVHVGALPGTPRASASVEALAAAAVADAEALAAAGFDAVIVENMHDRPYLRRQVGPEVVAAMTRVGDEVRRVLPASMALGVQILAGANRAAMAVALACGAAFVRAEGFVFAAVADEGLLEEADAGPLLRYRRAIGAESVRVLCDVKKKHSAHAITADVDLAETARAAEFFGADGVVVTGTATGEATAPADVEAVRSAVASIPVLVGSGVTPDRIPALRPHADGVIVGSWTKVDGRWDRPVDPARALALARAWRS